MVSVSSFMAEKPPVQRFGEKLKGLRVHHNMTLVELARLLGYATHGYLSELENGKKLPTIEFVLSIARLFNVTTDELLKDELELNLAEKEA